ncbi:MAG: alpha/beta fold hydrolase [Alphaproteobacteria bacterium]|nr:alpha/beta fold hydrolase [Alphaproteobacteria bacterium]
MGETLGVNPVGVCDSFFDLGGDSLSTVELLLAVEDGFGVSVELGRFLDNPTVEGLAAAINEGRDFRPSTALVTLKAHGTEPPLFFIHGAGGLAFTVFELGQALPGDRPIYAVQDPACDPGVEPAREIEAMAAALIEQIMTVQPRGPYHICGHSFGGLLAYEMAIQLRARGHDIAFLGMLDTPTPPAAMKGRGARARLRLAWRELRFLGQILTQAGPMAMDGCYVLFGAEARYRSGGSHEGAGSLPEMLRGAWANVLFRYFHKRAGLASAVERNSRLLMLRQPGIRRSIRLTGIHDAARRRYRPGRYDGTVTLFRAETASAETQGFPDDTLGWNRLAEKIVIHRAPGSHFTMTRGVNVPPLARVLSKALEGM